MIYYIQPITIKSDGGDRKIRLYGIDCPEVAHLAKEVSQPYGIVAKKFVGQKCRGKSVKIEERGLDPYGRMLGIITLQDGSCLNEFLLQNGLAWHSSRNDHSDRWAEIEQVAKKKKIGLWSRPNPVPVVEWRKNKLCKLNYQGLKLQSRLR